MKLPPHTKEKVIALALAGKPPAQIEREIGVSRYDIYPVIQYARSCGAAIPVFPKRHAGEAAAGRVIVPLELTNRFLPAAAARRVTVGALIRELLYTIADDKLIDAILDDEAAA